MGHQITAGVLSLKPTIHPARHDGWHPPPPLMIRTTRVEDTFELGWGESYKSSPSEGGNLRQAHVTGLRIRKPEKAAPSRTGARTPAMRLTSSRNTTPQWSRSFLHVPVDYHVRHVADSRSYQPHQYLSSLLQTPSIYDQEIENPLPR